MQETRNARTRGDIPVHDITAAVGGPSSPVAPTTNAFAQALKEKYGQVVLVLQGGGALGAYQVGVYQALHEAGVEPDWVIGTSIGAINGAMIAGNPVETRLDRLNTFWRRVEHSPAFGATSHLPPPFSTMLPNWATITAGVSGFFRPNPLAFLGLNVPLPADGCGRS
jgi:NTE family protein